MLAEAAALSSRAVAVPFVVRALLGEAHAVAFCASDGSRYVGLREAFDSNAWT
jgi:hypothetical protein